MLPSFNTVLLSPFAAVEKHRKIIFSHWKDLRGLLSSPGLKDILRKKQEQDLLPDSLGFNLFRLISGTYRWENFHSDILGALLDPAESHGAGHRHVHAFIEWLRTCRHLEGLNPQFFQDVEVKREKHGRVDIVICDKSAKKAIIVENKINGAPDMERQLPRYLDRLEDDDFDVVAIVYLTLNQIKKPSETGWRPATEGKFSDHDRIHGLLVPVVAFSHHSRNLLEWIQNCEQSTNEFDTLAAFRQYRQLIQHLGAHAMNDTLMNEFYDEITKDKSFLMNARSLVKIVNDLPQYRASRIKSLFESKCRPFLTIALWGTNRVVFLDDVGGQFDYLRIDIHCHETFSILTLWDRDYENYNMSRLDTAVIEMGLGGDFTGCPENKTLGITHSRMKKYQFPEDDDSLEADLTTLFNKVENWKSLHSSEHTAHAEAVAGSRLEPLG